MTDTSSRSPAAVTRVPVSSYRLQLNREFTFADARALLPYLCDLGVTEVYCSPVLQPRPGSSHGYDVCDPTQLNADLGPAEAFSTLEAALSAHGLGLILDIVPNHMSADPRHNPWWGDVLRNGAGSPHAAAFDIDWQRPGLEGRVLVPILGDDLETVLARGELRLTFEDGAYWLAYFDHRIPIDPSRAGLDTADSARLVAEVNGSDDSIDPSRLAALLESAPMALADWRVAARRLNYRRFFDVTELAGLRVERPEVFDAVHALVLALVARGAVTGLRVDHPDGLWDPGGYFDRLRRVAAGGGAGPYIAVEKILSPGEALPDGWRHAVHGTTGYNFLNDLNGVFVDARAEMSLSATCARLTGRSVPFADMVHEAKVLVLETSMAVELERLAERLDALMPAWGADDVRRVLREIVACFPVYRTYASAAGATAVDRQVITAAVRTASRRQPGDAPLFAELGRLLAAEPALVSAEVLEFVMRFQQLTGPVQAKGLEDTVFYRYPMLLSLNDVGGAPDRFARPVAAFHRANATRRADWPLEMLATTTHDTKRGEDARARINALSEMPEAWARAADRWFALNAACRRNLGGQPAPSPNDEYFFYQTLVGAWPAGPASAPVPTSASSDLVERMLACMAKAIREGKERTSWLRPDAAYEAAVAAFVEGTLAGPAAPDFLAAFVPFQRRAARLGIVNSLSQVVLKIASPGVPDFYQGSEFWDLSLVDPDNRRPVDFARRRAALEALAPWLEPTAGGAAMDVALGDLLARPWDGAIKLFVTARGLCCRRERSDLAVWGDYIPLQAHGAQATRVVAFARAHDDAALLAVVPRLAGAITDDDHPFPLGERAWADTTVQLPPSPAIVEYTDALTGGRLPVDATGAGPRLRAADLFRTLPVALLSGRSRWDDDVR